MSDDSLHHNRCLCCNRPSAHRHTPVLVLPASQLTPVPCADADQRALLACPWLFGFTMACMSALVLLKSPLTESLAVPVKAIVTAIIFTATVALAHYYAVPMIQWRTVAAQVDLRHASPLTLCPACISVVHILSWTTAIQLFTPRSHSLRPRTNDPLTC